MGFPPILFLCLGGVTLLAALAVVVHPRAAGSAVALLVAFCGMAAIYAFLGAPLVAAIQVMVYVGAVLVLFAFVILLFNDDPTRPRAGVRDWIWWGVVAAALLTAFAGFVHILRSVATGSIAAPAAAPEVGGSEVTVEAVAELLYSDYALPLELAGVLLLAATVAAVVLAKRHREGGGRGHA